MAPGSVARVRVSGAGETVILSGPVIVSTGVLESVAFTWAVEVPEIGRASCRERV